MDYEALNPDLEPWPYIPATEWAAVFEQTPPKLDDLELIWSEHDADFGGPARVRSAVIRLDGAIFLLQVALGWGHGDDYQPIEHPHGLMVDMSTENEPGPILDELLILLGVSHDDAQHINPECAFHEHRLMRQDDNGHEFEVGRFPSKSAAQKELNRFEKNIHKQHYWLERAG